MRPLSGETRREIEAWLAEWSDIKPSRPVSYFQRVRDLLASEAYWREHVRQIGGPEHDDNCLYWICLSCHNEGPSEDGIQHKADCAWKLAQ